MAKLKCPCGVTLSSVEQPNKVEHWLVPATILSEMYVSDLADVARSVWECPKCGRLAIEDNNTIKWYEDCPLT